VDAENPWPEQDATRAWHVAAVVENVPLGADHRLRKQVEAMLAAGFRVSVVTMRDELNEPYRRRPGLTLLEHAPPREPSGSLGYVLEYAWSFLCAATLLTRLRLRGRIDVVQFCQPPDIYFPVAAALRWGRTRIVVDQRDLMPELLGERYPQAPSVLVRVLRLLERATQRVADRTITVNDVLRDRLVASGGRTETVSVVWNGPVLSRVEAARPDPSLQVPDRPLVVWVGKMGLQDGVDRLPVLVDTVVHRLGHPEVRFAFLGDGEWLDPLRRRVDELGLQPWVTITGWVPEETVFRHLASAEAGVDTSQQAEVTPVKVLEYMAFGLPFASFDVAETRRLASGAAVLAPAGDVGALAEALVSVLDGEGPGRRLGEVGRRRVRETLAWERQTRTYLDVVGPGENTAASMC
jgi:glycosyltransferase involved in cell wall biosynthesis